MVNGYIEKSSSNSAIYYPDYHSFRSEISSTILLPFELAAYLSLHISTAIST